MKSLDIHTDIHAQTETISYDYLAQVLQMSLATIKTTKEIEIDMKSNQVIATQPTHALAKIMQVTAVINTCAAATHTQTHTHTQTVLWLSIMVIYPPSLFNLYA